MSKKDTVSLVTDGLDAAKGDDVRFAETRAALENLDRELDAAIGVRNNLGLKVNVARRVAKTVLERYPKPAG